MTELSRINDLFHSYAPTDVVSVTKNDAAFANEVFMLTTALDERYVLKILQSQHPDAITNEVVMQQRLLDAGITTAQYLEITPGEYVGRHGDERFVLSKYLPGNPPVAVTPPLIRSFGAMLARLHDCLNGIAIPETDMQWLNPAKVAADIAAYEGPVKESLRELLDYGGAIFDADLPRAVIHGDLWLNNVFAANDVITAVFDFETAEYTVRLVDIARTYTSMRFNSALAKEEVIEGLVAGYDSRADMALSPAERAHINRAIAYVCGACATWHAVHGTRYTEPYIRFGQEVLPQTA
jgi:homoserine kinase type II